ncbi:MAG: BON domain-containing protein [Alphaproteobacteria bacterium]|nr:BON domain-containing protein [Alphaproteobacteria bacterium]
MKKITLLALSISLLATSGCVPLLIGGGTETAVVAAQERSVGGAVDDTGILLAIKGIYAKQKDKDMFLNIEIKSVEGRVLLTGNVDKPDSQIEAVRLAWQVSGVKEIINEIQINDKSGFVNYAKDVWVSSQVRTRLILGKKIHSINYSVITVNQVVYLMGVAQDQDELDRATYVASTCSYVQKVVSYVRLKDDPSRGYRSH